MNRLNYKSIDNAHPTVVVELRVKSLAGCYRAVISHVRYA